MSPGILENLFNPTPRDQPCLGSVSPVSNVNNPGLPSTGGIGVKFGCSESPSAATAAFPLAAPALGVGNAAGAADDEDDAEEEDDGVAADELTGAGAASGVPVADAESGEPAAVFAVILPADASLAGAPVCRGLLSSAKPAVATKSPATTKIAAGSSTFKVRLLSTATAPVAPR